MSKKWYPPYKCTYCFKALYHKDYLYKVHMYAQETKKDRTSQFSCQDCHACHAYFQYSVLTKSTTQISFFSNKERTYQIIINPQVPQFQLKHYIRYSDSFQYGEETLLDLNDIPKITPQNANEKIKLYLLFS